MLVIPVRSVAVSVPTGDMISPPPDLNFIVPKRTPSTLLIRLLTTRFAMVIFGSLHGVVGQSPSRYLRLLPVESLTWEPLTGPAQYPTGFRALCAVELFTADTVVAHKVYVDL